MRGEETREVWVLLWWFCFFCVGEEGLSVGRSISMISFSSITAPSTARPCVSLEREEDEERLLRVCVLVLVVAVAVRRVWVVVGRVEEEEDGRGFGHCETL
jgi:hypothetical protein